MTTPTPITTLAEVLERWPDLRYSGEGQILLMRLAHRLARVEGERDQAREALATLLNESEPAAHKVISEETEQERDLDPCPWCMAKRALAHTGGTE